MSNELTRATLWVVLGLLVVALLTIGCGTAPAVEQPGSVAVAGTDEPTPVQPTATPSATPSTSPRAGPRASPTATDTPRPTPDASQATPTPIPGAQMAPDFSLPDLDGQTWTLTQFRGRPVMLFVWATW